MAQELHDPMDTRPIVIEGNARIDGSDITFNN